MSRLWCTRLEGGESKTIPATIDLFWIYCLLLVGIMSVKSKAVYDNIFKYFLLGLHLHILGIFEIDKNYIMDLLLLDT